jgi:hypothetical protein
MGGDANLDQLRSEADDHQADMPVRNSLRHAFPSAPAAYRCGHNLLERDTSADL